MKIVEKIGTEISLVALPTEKVLIGDYLLIEDEEQKSKLVVQIYDERFLNNQNIIEEIVRDEIMKSSTEGLDSDPLQINTISTTIQDIKLLKCKIRGSIDNERFNINASWIPSRAKSKIKKMSIPDLLILAKKNNDLKITLGETVDGEVINISAQSIDGQLNIITGKKESGKSHLAKLLATNLVRYGAYVIIFDLNNEYSGLVWNKDGSPSINANKTVLLSPCNSLVFSFQYLGLATMTYLLTHVLEIPGASLREFTKMWETLENQKEISISSFKNMINNSHCNEFVRDALFSRFNTLISSRLFSDNKSMEIENIISQLKNGGLIVVSLGSVSPLYRRMIVEILLSKIVELLEKKLIPPVFLLAEEAHLYLSETYWTDIVTRMRHFGIFATFITNQPNAIGDEIFRQVDNVFLFNFTNDNDLEKIARVAMIDTDTVKSLVRNLPQRTCLAIGKVVANLPIVVKVSQTETLNLGETRFFFNETINSNNLIH